jgi:hypothetical protein
MSHCGHPRSTRRPMFQAAETISATTTGASPPTADCSAGTAW